MWTWLLATAGSIAFFNYVRIGRRSNWLNHKLKGLFLHHRQYRAIPNGKKRSFDRAWLIDARTGDELAGSYRSPLMRGAQTAFLLEHNNRLQEACEERWNALLLTTD
jgi:hypothetical protein